MEISSTPRVVIIVQARMGSTRLPGKVLKEVLHKPLLTYLIERLRRVKLAHGIVIATTVEEEDDPIVDLSLNEGVQVFRGSEEHVLSRYLGAAGSSFAQVIVRVTSDCPLIDPTIIDEAIHRFLTQKPQCDCLSNTQVRTFPRGMDVEVFSLRALEIAAMQTKLPVEQEHVTLHFYRNPQEFTLGGFEREPNVSAYRLTVDTPEDFLLISKIIEALYPKSPNFSLEEMITLLKEHPDWCKINERIIQKEIIT